MSWHTCKWILGHLAGVDCRQFTQWQKWTPNQTEGFSGNQKESSHSPWGAGHIQLIESSKDWPASFNTDYAAAKIRSSAVYFSIAPHESLNSLDALRSPFLGSTAKSRDRQKPQQIGSQIRTNLGLNQRFLDKIRPKRAALNGSISYHGFLWTYRNRILPIDIATMGNTPDGYQLLVIVDFIQNAVISHPHAPILMLT